MMPTHGHEALPTGVQTASPLTVKGLATQTFHWRAWGVVMILAGTVLLAVAAA